jgi:hypothetical protein
VVPSLHSEDNTPANDKFTAYTNAIFFEPTEGAPTLQGWSFTSLVILLGGMVLTHRKWKAVTPLPAGSTCR